MKQSYTKRDYFLFFNPLAMELIGGANWLSGETTAIRENSVHKFLLQFVDGIQQKSHFILQLQNTSKEIETLRNISVKKYTRRCLRFCGCLLYF